MTHSIKLVDFAFNAMKNGKKDVELRLNDEKVKNISVGDTLIFIQINTGEELKTKVVNLYRYNTFKEMFDSFDNSRFGLSKNDTFEIMYNFYTKEEEKEYGGLAIEIELI